MHARFLSLFLAVSLLLSAGSSLAETYTVSGLFSIDFDQHTFTIDDRSYQSDSGKDSRWLFLLYSKDTLIDVSIEKAEGYQVLSLDGADEKTIAAYIDEMDFIGCEHLETVHANGIPFGIFRLQDEDGPYLLAETLADGWCIDFYAYYDDQDREPDEALMEALLSVITTFTPCRCEVIQ